MPSKLKTCLNWGYTIDIVQKLCPCKLNICIIQTKSWFQKVSIWFIHVLLYICLRCSYNLVLDVGNFILLRVPFYVVLFIVLFLILGFTYVPHALFYIYSFSFYIAIEAVWFHTLVQKSSDTIPLRLST